MQILRNIKTGKNGGRPKKITTGYEKEKTTGYLEKKPNENENENVNENENENENVNGAEQNIQYIEIISYLNNKANTKYKDNTEKTKKLIKARYNEGFTYNDFVIVIDKKCKEWLNTDMEKYLRPETLFGNKFESYLNARTIKKTNNITNCSSRNYTNTEMNKFYDNLGGV